MKSIDTSNNIITLYRNLTSAYPEFGWQASSFINSGVYNFDHKVKINKSAHQVDLSHTSKMVPTQSTFPTNTKNL
ncbi:hypothetical protein [uncultured Maribacter sp.]|uniref:hypothetical protein n=1 Tax=uncultured Maribacter sp. TaxID=431308 RepID=UPI00262323F3|nr:hypothetical protein [uncultured Maribacter sp.]